MILGSTYEASQATRKHYVLPNGTGFWKSEYIISDHKSAPAPHALLVEQDANQVILPHFHEQNQFQVIINGGGTLGRTVVSPITVHYAGAYTGYGPITAGEEGLWYFTLRPMMDNGAQFLPESRPKMKDWPKKHYHSAPLQSISTNALAALARAESITVQHDDDGMRVETIRVPAGTNATAPDPAQGGGQFFLVTNGSMHIDGKKFGRLSCVWVAHTEAAMTIQAGAEGVELLMLQCPRTDYRPTYDPALYKYPD